MRPAAIFDLDGTLLPRTSAERLFLRRAVRAGELGPWTVAAGAAWALARWAARRTASPFESKDYLRQAPCAALEALGVVCVHDDVLPRLRSDLLVALEGHRERGDLLVLLTGTFDFLGAEIAKALRLEAWAATVLERRSGHFTGRAVPPHPHGAGKVEVLLELARRHAIDLGRSTAYANRGSDIAQLALTAYPQAVSPDRALRAQARRAHWPVWEDDAAAASRGSG